MLSQLGITVPVVPILQLENVAAVMVTAQLPAFGRQGQNIDVVVSQMGNAKSLRGGTLLMTPPERCGQPGIRQRRVDLAGRAGAAAGGSSVTGEPAERRRITGGATIERELPNAVWRR
ncbi:flagellar basal body P-ring protein FlgI [Shigella flexneri]